MSRTEPTDNTMRWDGEIVEGDRATVVQRLTAEGRVVTMELVYAREDGDHTVSTRMSIDDALALLSALLEATDDNRVNSVIGVEFIGQWTVVKGQKRLAEMRGDAASNDAGGKQ